MTLDPDKLSKSLVHWGYYSYNFLQDDFIKKSIAESTTPDIEFLNGIINLQTTDVLPAIYVVFYISKDLRLDPATLVKGAVKAPVDKEFFIVDEQEGHRFTFSILVKLSDKYMVRKLTPDDTSYIIPA